jgi:hypothetical protein
MSFFWTGINTVNPARGKTRGACEVTIRKGHFDRENDDHLWHFGVPVAYEIL